MSFLTSTVERFNACGHRDRAAEPFAYFGSFGDDILFDDETDDDRFSRAN